MYLEKVGQGKVLELLANKKLKYIFFSSYTPELNIGSQIVITFIAFNPWHLKTQHIGEK